jgi:hopene-associated glycosyltransferase HpnB
MTNQIGLGLTVLSLLLWIGLLGWRGQFWRSDQKLELLQPEPAVEAAGYPSICAVIPARNEADLLPITLRSLLAQDYLGRLTIILVDDHSTDETAAIAQSLAQSLIQSQTAPQRSLSVVSGEPLPPGWTGKLWAMNCGIQQAQTLDPSPDYFLLTDADIAHDRSNLSSLVAKAQRDRCDLVSLMVQLRCQSLWERLLVPAFVFFFQKLYPFRWVNDPDCSTAAAAGGCILIRRSALTRIGGIQSVRHALIDDCALAEKTKSTASDIGGNKIWLGLSDTTQSLRPYPSLASLWNMVARTAFTQLNHSIWLLLGTVIGMILIYTVPPIGMMTGLLIQNWLLAIAGAIGWLLMAWSYLPTIRLYRSSPMLTFSLPITACLYTLMTLESAMRHWQGRGGAWKGRVYPEITTSR